MKYYQLSPQYRLTTVENTGEAIASHQGDFYGLIDTASGECVVINSTMYLFLKQYETPKTLNEIAQVFADTFEATRKEVLPIVRSFYKDMQERSVIIAPKAAQNNEIITPFAIGSVVDTYRIDALLSANLPLEVYKATGLKTKETVILKVLRLASKLSKRRREAAQESFKKEFAIQKLLRGCPTICQLLDLTPNYAVLEWFDSTSLRRRLADEKGIDAALRDNLLAQICDSYAFMHQKNILHGDVHARNILLSAHNQIKIIDFDLGHLLQNEKDFPAICGGAPEFIAPENVKFDAFEIVHGTANYQTEVYQLGIIGYWMTYGKVPFSGTTWQELGNAILSKPVDFPLTNNQNEKVSLRMRLFLKKCLAKQPRNRFASAKEMQEEFALVLMKKRKTLILNDA
jgi:eukaryotic-like serine/threonine-protein kinase